jgi:hypothetical protein
MEDAMLQNAALDVAIGLVLMYLVLSLVCTVVNEYVASKLNLRSRSLEASLFELLDDQSVRERFYSHGLIAGTTRALMHARPLFRMTAAPRALDLAASAVPPPPDHPSYIASTTFVAALVGSLTGSDAASTGVPQFSEVQSAIRTLPQSRIKSALVASLVTAQGDFEKFRASVATWFDDSMDRLSGVYKRNLKRISILVGCGIALIVNADSFQVGKALWSDSALRAEMVQVADTSSKARADQTDYSAIMQEFQTANDQLRPLPVGWPLCVSQSAAITSQSSTHASREACPPRSGLIWFGLTKLLGWYATGLALSLGAPFWFDLLSKFINIRSAGIKPERQAPMAS